MSVLPRTHSSSQNPLALPFGIQKMSTSSDAGTAISNGVMVAAVIFLFVSVVFIFFLYLYAKRYWAVAPSHRIIVMVDHLPHRGLDASILRSLPVSVFRTGDFTEGLECAVCLSDVSEGEEVRLLPKCNHIFHLECIDMWLHSHSTCPLCRCPLEIPTDSQLLPTNVLFWGTRSNVGSSSNGVLVIDIPLISPLPSSRLPIAEEEIRTPTSATSRLRSLGKMLSIRGKSSSNDDIEQGVVGEAPPKTPRNS